MDLLFAHAGGEKRQKALIIAEMLHKFDERLLISLLIKSKSIEVPWEKECRFSQHRQNDGSNVCCMHRLLFLCLCFFTRPLH